MSEAKKFGEIRDSAAGEVLVQMFGPGRYDDAISIGLRVLTHQLRVLKPEADGGGGFFGGAYGYGVDFENDTFLMHHYCWCHKNDGTCLWCIHGDNPQFIPLLNAKFGTEKATYYDKVTRYYDPPHFWHKTTNFRVRWYKYIGRDNAFNRSIDGQQWKDILESTLASFGGQSLDAAIGSYLEAEGRNA